MTRRKITIEVSGKRYDATAIYRHEGVRIQRTRSGPNPEAAYRAAKVAVLEEVDKRGIDPELVEAERILMAG